MHPDRFQVIGLTAARNVDKMRILCERYQPALVAMADPVAAADLRKRIGSTAPKTAVLEGDSGIAVVAAARESGVVVAAIVGAAGLLPTLAAVDAGKRVLLANKEALVMAGQLFMDKVAASGAVLLPIDSEQNAIMQCIGDARMGVSPATAGISRLVLTASGGPFLKTPLTALSSRTPKQACAHPTWEMGPKISVDSATMMNKGLEIIETTWLFGISEALIDVVIHPQSAIHSLVEFVDGAVLAQMARPDMKIPIAVALAWPKRIATGVPPLDLVRLGAATFEAPSLERFPSLALARAASRTGGTAPAILNAANEVAVAGFLSGTLCFTDIASVVEATLAELPSHAALDLEQVFADDLLARTVAGRIMRRRAVGGG